MQASRSLPSHALFCFVLVCGVWLLPSSAQISPGPLARPHQSLSGTANCTTCHRLSAGQPTFKCLDCHSEIASRLNAHKGLHSTYNIQPGSSQECARCHSDHNGENFPLIKWDTGTFDHKLTGYVLEGKHAALTCNRCHSAAHISPAERATIKIKDPARTFLGLSQTCTTCHQDHHDGRLGQNCLQCHNYTDWKALNVGKFDHSKTRFPLTGLHAAAACEKCHIPGPDNKPRYAGLAFGKCSDCHADPHKGAFPQGCSSCHSTAGWKKVSTSVLSQNFDHSKTKFPLLGKHSAVNCAQCHTGGNFKKPVAFGKCTDCHTPDPHKGQFMQRPGGIECSNCHTVNGWKPSTFGLAEHAQTQYPLKGGHAKLECSQCHIPKGKDTVFKLKFARCTDCHKDEHGGQFAGAPYGNDCERCHTVESYRPSTFTPARHKETRFALAGGHVAIPCADCHKQSAGVAPKTLAQYHWQNLACTSCHADPHNGQFDARMRAAGSGAALGCQACHSTKAWNDLTRFDHSTTAFPLVGAHRATACIDCHKPPNMETRLIHVNFKAAPAKCQECHEEVHGGQFAKNGVTACAECHTSSRWKPSTFDHETSTSFSLRGAHQTVRCEECHKSVRVVEGKQVLFYKPTPKECAACHGGA